MITQLEGEHYAKRPSFETMKALAAALDTTVAYLTGEDQVLTDWSAKTIAEDRSAPSGLRLLADREQANETHRITREEWRALHSLLPPVPLTAEGYVSILYALRSAIAVTQT